MMFSYLLLVWLTKSDKVKHSPSKTCSILQGYSTWLHSRKSSDNIIVTLQTTKIVTGCCVSLKSAVGFLEFWVASTRK